MNFGLYCLYFLCVCELILLFFGSIRGEGWELCCVGIVFFFFLEMVMVVLRVIDGYDICYVIRMNKD